MFYKKMLSCGLVASAFLMPSAVEAGSVNITFDKYKGSYGAGVFQVTKNSGGAGLADSFLTFCIEYVEHIRLGKSYDYEVVPTSDAPNDGWSRMGAAQADLLGKWFGKYYHAFGGGDYASWTKSNATLFQLGIWEIVADTTFDLASGVFDAVGGSAPGVGPNASSAVRSEVESMFANVDRVNGPSLRLAAFTNNSLQDHVTVVPVPAAAAALLPMMGLTYVVRRRRRRRVGV